MDTYRIAFIGHYQIKNQLCLIEKIEKVIREKLRQKEFVELFFERDSDFGFLAALAIKEAQQAVGSDNSRLILVQPHPIADDAHYGKLYDEIRYFADESIDPLTAIPVRNHWMIDRADLLVAYVEADREDSAVSALEYAQKRSIEMINLAVIEQ